MLERKVGEVLLVTAQLSCMEDGVRKPVYIREAADRLRLTPTAVSRMVQVLIECGYAELRRYGYVYLTDSGRDMAAYILHRRQIVRAFLTSLTGRHGGDVAAECARIEYALERDTVEAMERLLTAEGVVTASSAEVHYEKRHNAEVQCIDMP